MTFSAGTYSGQIPVKSAGTTVIYYVRAQDSAASTVTDPASAPASTTRGARRDVDTRAGG